MMPTQSTQCHLRRSPDSPFSPALCAIVLLAFLAADGWAQTYPSRPIRIMIPSAQGAPSDVVTRLIAPKLAEAWGQPVIPENRAGATGMLALEAVAKSPPDGHTIVLVTGTNLTTTLMHQKFLLASEFSPIGTIGSTPVGIAVNASLPVSNLAEWVAYAKARPRQLSYGSGGAWGTLHLCMESMNEQAGIQMLHVPYTSAPAAYNAMLGGQIHAYCAAGPTMVTILKQDKLRLLAVTSLKPSRLMPNVPPIADTLPGFEMDVWLGLATTRGTPPEVVSRINAEVAKAVKTTELTERMLRVFVEPRLSTPAEFAAFLERESARWGKFLKDHNAKPED